MSTNLSDQEERNDRIYLKGVDHARSNSILPVVDYVIGEIAKIGNTPEQDKEEEIYQAGVKEGNLEKENYGATIKKTWG